MATILDKDITRETSVKFEDREIQITLTENQSISMKLKGMKSGILEIGIEDLYKQLKGEPLVEDIKPEEVKTPKTTSNVIDLSAYKGDENLVISLHDIRHAVNVHDFDVSTKVKFDNLFVEMINDCKQRKNLK